MSLEKHVMSSVVWTGLRRECRRSAHTTLRRDTSSVCFHLSVEKLMSSISAYAIVIQFFFFFAWSYYSLSHWISPSLSLFVLVFLSHLGWNVTLFHVWAVCIPSVFLSINYWAIKFTFPRGKTVVVDLSRRHSRAQVGRWDDGIVGDDVWIIQCWSYFETGVWQVIHHLKQLN